MELAVDLKKTSNGGYLPASERNTYIVKREKQLINPFDSKFLPQKEEIGSSDIKSMRRRSFRKISDDYEEDKTMKRAVFQLSEYIFDITGLNKNSSRLLVHQGFMGYVPKLIHFEQAHNVMEETVQPIYCFLFNDLLLITKVAMKSPSTSDEEDTFVDKHYKSFPDKNFTLRDLNNNPNFKFRAISHVSLLGAEIIDYEEKYVDRVNKLNYMFGVMNYRDKTIELFLHQNKEAKEAWMNKIDTAIWDLLLSIILKNEVIFKSTNYKEKQKFLLQDIVIMDVLSYRTNLNPKSKQLSRAFVMLVGHELLAFDYQESKLFARDDYLSKGNCIFKIDLLDVTNVLIDFEDPKFGGILSLTQNIFGFLISTKKEDMSEIRYYFWTRSLVHRTRWVNRIRRTILTYLEECKAIKPFLDYSVGLVYEKGAFEKLMSSDKTDSTSKKTDEEIEIEHEKEEKEQDREKKRRLERVMTEFNLKLHEREPENDIDEEEIKYLKERKIRIEELIHKINEPIRTEAEEIEKEKDKQKNLTILKILSLKI